MPTSGLVFKLTSPIASIASLTGSTVPDNLVTLVCMSKSNAPHSSLNSSAIFGYVNLNSERLETTSATWSLNDALPSL